MRKKMILTKRTRKHVSAKQLYDIMRSKIADNNFTWDAFLDIVVDDDELQSSCFFSVIYPVGFWEGFKKVYGNVDKTMYWYEMLDFVLLEANFAKGDDVFIDFND